MILKDWLDHNNILVSRFGRNANISLTTLYVHLRTGKRIMPDIALRIEEATNGEVSAPEAIFPERYERYERPPIVTVHSVMKACQ